MKPKIHEHKHGSQRAVNKTADHFQHPLKHLRRAFLFCILLRLSVSMEAQQSPAEQQPVTINASTVQVNSCPLPVYFNYHRRQLQHDGHRIDGITFLNMCRSIPDSSIQQQVERYDNYTAQKQKLGFTAMGSGFAGMAFLGGALSTSDTGTGTNGLLILSGVVSILAVPVLAICTSAPHQQRKTVLFRDLPIAYNAYVEAQRSAGDCQ